MNSEFQAWFIDQHGPRLSSGMSSHSDRELNDMVRSGRSAERVLARRERWDEKQQSALYAWTARNITANLLTKPPAAKAF